MQAQLALLIQNKKNNKFLKTSLLLALLLNLIILIFLLFYSLDQEHTTNFFSAISPAEFQDPNTDSLPVYFDMPGDPNGDPASVATTIENKSVGYEGGEQGGASNASSQFNNSGEPSFGFDDLDGIQDEKQVMPDKSKLDIKNLDEKLNNQEIINNLNDLKDINQEIKDLAQDIKDLKTISNINNLEEVETELNPTIKNSGDISLWKHLENLEKKEIKKLEPKPVANNIQEKPRSLPKKSGSIFGKQLLEGFKNFMNEQRYAQSDTNNSTYMNSLNSQNNYSSNGSGTSNNGITGAQLGRALTSQLKGEINGMLLIKELALASRLDSTMVHSDKSINKNIPFELTIGENGKVLNVELKESCGVHDVDRHFIKLVYQASPINHYARHYKGQPFKINLNIRFVVPPGANRLLVTYGEQY